MSDTGLAGLREALSSIRDYGYQPRYNGRPSCPFCQNFVDDEETHRPGCVLVAALAAQVPEPSLDAAWREAEVALPDGWVVKLVGPGGIGLAIRREMDFEAGLDLGFDDMTVENTYGAFPADLATLADRTPTEEHFYDRADQPEPR